MPGVEEAINAASSGSDAWVSILLIVIVMGGFGILGFLIKKLYEGREQDLQFQRTTLVDLNEKTTSCVQENSDCLKELKHAVVDLKDRECPYGNGNLKPET